MDDPGKVPGNDSDQALFRTMRRRRHPGGPPWRMIGGLIVLLLLIGAGWYGYRFWSADAPTPPPASEATETDAEQPTRPVAQVPPLDLPALDGSDPLVRALVGGLSQHPRLATWLVPDDLVRRFVVSVVNISTGGSPAEHLQVMAPVGPFEAESVDGGLVVDAATFDRYDPIVAAFTSLDTQAGARLYLQLHPLFVEAYQELGLPETFDETMATAMGKLLSVAVPEGPVEVEAYEGVFVYQDPELESLSPAEKHLLRFGPENARAMQAKLRQLSAAIGIALPTG